MLARLDEPVLDLHRRLMSHLSPDELRQLSRLLEGPLHELLILDGR